MSTLKTFFSYELVQDIVNITNKYADKLNQDPEIQEKMNAKHRSIFNLGKLANLYEMRRWKCEHKFRHNFNDTIDHFCLCRTKLFRNN